MFTAPQQQTANPHTQGFQHHMPWRCTFCLASHSLGYFPWKCKILQSSLSKKKKVYSTKYFKFPHHFSHYGVYGDDRPQHPQPGKSKTKTNSSNFGKYFPSPYHVPASIKYTLRMLFHLPIQPPHCSGDCHYLSCTNEQTRKPQRAKGFPEGQGSCLTGVLNTDLSLNQVHCFAYRVIVTIFLNSIYMCQDTVLVFIFLAYFTLYNGLQFHPSH